MRLRNILITVNDIERSKEFYKELFGLDVVLDNGRNVIMTEGLVLQERVLWEQATGLKTIPESNASVLYFEERDLEGFAQKWRQYCDCHGFEARIIYQEADTRADIGIGTCAEAGMNRGHCEPVHRTMCFYDPDGNLIEVGTPWR